MLFGQDYRGLTHIFMRFIDHGGMSYCAYKVRGSEINNRVAIFVHIRVWPLSVYRFSGSVFVLHRFELFDVLKPFSLDILLCLVECALLDE